MPEQRWRFDREFGEGAVRIVRETSRPIAQVAADLWINPGTLGNWVEQERVDRGEDEGLSGDERAELARLRAVTVMWRGSLHVAWVAARRAGVGVSDEQCDRKSSPTLTQWFTGALGVLVAVVTIVSAFVKVRPVEIDTPAEFFAVALFVVFVACVGAFVWGRWHRRLGWRPTALLGVLAVLALTGGLLLGIGTDNAASSPRVASDPPIISPRAPTTTPGTTEQVEPGLGGDGSGPGDSGLTLKPIGGDQVIGPNSMRSPATVPHPTPPPAPRATQATDTAGPVTDAVRYQGEFRLSASQESVDLDLNPPQAYGPANELAVDDHAIWTVPPYTKGAAVSGSPTRAQCVEAINRVNPPADYFDDPQPGDEFCVRTSDGRYALVRVVSAATKDFTLALTVWN